MKKWKVLFAIFSFIYVISLVQLPFEDDLTISDFIGAVTGGLTLVPFYGFAYQVVVCPRRVVQLIAVLNMLLATYLLYYGVLVLIGYFTIGQVIATIFCVFFLFVFIYPQYMYAFKCEKLWQKDV